MTDLDELLYKISQWNYQPSLAECEAMAKAARSGIAEIRSAIGAIAARQAALDARLDSLGAEEMQKRAAAPPQLYAVPKAQDIGNLAIPARPQPVWNWRAGRYLYPNGAEK